MTEGNEDETGIDAFERHRRARCAGQAPAIHFVSKECFLCGGSPVLSAPGFPEILAWIFAQIRDDRGGFGDDHDVVRSAHSSAGLGVLLNQRKTMHDQPGQEQPIA